VQIKPKIDQFRYYITAKKYESLEMRILQMILTLLTHQWLQILVIVFYVIATPFPLHAEIADKESEGRQIFSLIELYRLGLKLSEQIRIAENQIVIAQKDEDRAFSIFGPTLSGFGGYVRYNESGKIQPEYGHEYGVKIQQQFTINGRELIILQAAKDTIKQRKYSLDAVTEEYLFNMASSYYDIVNKKKRVEILKQNVNRLETHRDAVVTQLKLEEVPKTALLRTEAELSGARSDLVQAENALVFAYATLARWLELQGSYDVIPPDSEEDSVIADQLELLVEKALDHRSDLKELEMALTLVDENIDILKSEYWPTLSFEAGYKRQETNPSEFSEDETIYGAVNLDVVLFDWGFRSATISQEKARQRSAKLQLQVKSKQIALEVEQAYLTIKAARSVIRALTDKLKFSRADYDAVSLQFSVGQADILDLMDANTVLLNSERELLEAQYSLALARIGLERAQGIFLNNVNNQLASAD